MCKSLLTITAALAILSLGSLASSPVQAGGGATSAPSKYNSAAQNVSVEPARHQPAQASAFAITEFSSSSAKSPASKR
jgi:hypothetical protein